MKRIKFEAFDPRWNTQGTGKETCLYVGHDPDATNRNGQHGVFIQIRTESGLTTSVIVSPEEAQRLGATLIALQFTQSEGVVA